MLIINSGNVHVTKLVFLFIWYFRPPVIKNVNYLTVHCLGSWSIDEHCIELCDFPLTSTTNTSIMRCDLLQVGVIFPCLYNFLQKTEHDETRCTYNLIMWLQQCAVEHDETRCTYNFPSIMLIPTIADYYETRFTWNVGLQLIFNEWYSMSWWIVDYLLDCALCWTVVGLKTTC